MECTDFKTCIGENPLSKVFPSAVSFDSIPSILYFVVNLAIYAGYAVLTIMIVYNLAKIIYSLFFADPDEKVTYDTMQDGVKAAIFCALGLMVISSINYVLVLVLKLFQIDTGPLMTPFK